MYISSHNQSNLIREHSISSIRLLLKAAEQCEDKEKHQIKLRIIGIIQSPNMRIMKQNKK